MNFALRQCLKTKAKAGHMIIEKLQSHPEFCKQKFPFLGLSSIYKQTWKGFVEKVDNQ